MTLPRLVSLAILIAALLAVAASSSAAAKLENCGSGVRAAKVGCAKAKRIAKEYAKTGHRSIWGYTCSAGDSQGRCVLDRKLVLFDLG
jgi:hypothetical protein